MNRQEGERKRGVQLLGRKNRRVAFVQAEYATLGSRRRGRGQSLESNRDLGDKRISWLNGRGLR